MNFTRRHISLFSNTILGVFTASWMILTLAIPLQVMAMAETHQIFSVFNAKEGCFELVVDHHENKNPDHIKDLEQHDSHLLHELCCYNEYLIHVKKDDLDHFSIGIEFTVPGDRYISHNTSSVYLFEGNLPPPTTLRVLHSTRLLI